MTDTGARHAARHRPSRPAAASAALARRRPARRARRSWCCLVLVIVAIGAPWIAPYAPTAQDVNNMLAPPGPAHLLGTDDLGRDMFSAA